MKPNKVLFVFLVCCTLLRPVLYGQTMDSLPGILPQDIRALKPEFPVKSCLIPATLIGYGVLTLHDNELLHFNREIKEEVWSEHVHKRINFDNYLQWSPAVAVYGLNLLGIKGKNKLFDQSMLYVLSNMIMNSTVFPLKKFSKVLRPDGSSYTSFPSGHTAEAFLAAEFLRQEYKDVSPWYGVAGYAAAITTGYLRLYNNKHWINDVIAGAGFGILSTKCAYWLYPKIKKLFDGKKESTTLLSPFYQAGGAGLSLVYRFHK